MNHVRSYCVSAAVQNNIYFLAGEEIDGLWQMLYIEFNVLSIRNWGTLKAIPPPNHTIPGKVCFVFQGKTFPGIADKLDLFLAYDNPRYFPINLRYKLCDIVMGVHDLVEVDSSFLPTSCANCDHVDLLDDKTNESSGNAIHWNPSLCRVCESLICDWLVTEANSNNLVLNISSSLLENIMKCGGHVELLLPLLWSITIWLHWTKSIRLNRYGEHVQPPTNFILGETFTLYPEIRKSLTINQC